MLHSIIIRQTKKRSLQNCIICMRKANIIYIEVKSNEG